MLSQAQSPGGSADTFRGLLSYMDAHKVELLVYENSDNLDDGHTEGLPETPLGQRTKFSQQRSRHEAWKVRFFC